MRLERILAVALGSVVGVIATPAGAADAETDAKIKALEAQVELLRTQVEDLKVGTTSKFAEAQKQISAETITMTNGRPTITTADGDFSISLRSLVQFDGGYYDQDNRPPAAPKLSSGTNFRRDRFGIEGRVFSDWEYSFIYDFGGSGTEGSTITSAYIQYDALPALLRVGAFAPYANFEDSAGAADLLFLERATVTEIQRSLAGGDGRSAISLVKAGDRLFGSLALTGGRANQSGVFDEQQALLGRTSYLLESSPNSKVALGVNGTWIYHTANVFPPPGVALSLANPTELRVDDTGNNGAPTNLISTGNINANSLTQWGVDGGANYKGFYVEGGYYAFNVDRRNSLPDADFYGWYVAASWMLTGEQRRYDPARGSFRSPAVLHPVGSPGWQGATNGVPIKTGWGAWELALRYSYMDLNDQAFDPVAANRIRGGDQDIWTFGLNWYINNTIKAQFNYQWVDVNRLTAAGAKLGQDLDQISMRWQFAF